MGISYYRPTLLKTCALIVFSIFIPAVAIVAMVSGRSEPVGMTGMNSSVTPIAERIAHAFYVSPKGDDKNNGTSPATSFRTLERAQAAMRQFGTAPYTTYLEGGVYQRTEALDLVNNDDQNKSWVAYPGQSPTLDGGGRTARGIHIVASGVVIKGITVRNFAESGLFATYCDHLLIAGNNVLDIMTPDWRTNVLGSSIFLLRVRNSIIANNYVNGNTATGIQVNGGGTGDDNSGDEVSNNRVYNTCRAVNDCGAIYFRDLGHVSTGQKIINNIVGDYGAKEVEHVAIYLDDETSHVVVAGNIVYGTGTYGILIHGGDHNIVRNNIFDISQAVRLGLYQDDVGSGGDNYGMAGNQFLNNIIYSASVQPGQLWDFIDQSGQDVARLAVSNNIYYDPRLVLPNIGTIVDRSPIYANPLFVDPSRHNYKVPTRSPAAELGFEPDS
jgi:parallel beta-helix repeat protein